MSEDGTSTDSESQVRKWCPLSSIERRVFGVLIEKAKTTPDNYPLTLNSLTSGCNQKSNRDPQMSLEPHQVEDGLETLRRDNAVAEVQGDVRGLHVQPNDPEFYGQREIVGAIFSEPCTFSEQLAG